MDKFNTGTGRNLGRFAPFAIPHSEKERINGYLALKYLFKDPKVFIVVVYTLVSKDDSTLFEDGTLGDLIVCGVFNNIEEAEGRAFDIMSQTRVNSVLIFNQGEWQHLNNVFDPDRTDFVPPDLHKTLDSAQRRDLKNDYLEKRRLERIQKEVAEEKKREEDPTTLDHYIKNWWDSISDFNAWKNSEREAAEHKKNYEKTIEKVKLQETKQPEHKLVWFETLFTQLRDRDETHMIQFALNGIINIIQKEGLDPKGYGMNKKDKGKEEAVSPTKSAVKSPVKEVEKEASSEAPTNVLEGTSVETLVVSSDTPVAESSAILTPEPIVISVKEEPEASLEEAMEAIASLDNQTEEVEGDQESKSEEVSEDSLQVSEDSPHAHPRNIITDTLHKIEEEVKDDIHKIAHVAGVAIALPVLALEIMSPNFSTREIAVENQVEEHTEEPTEEPDVSDPVQEAEVNPEVYVDEQGNLWDTDVKQEIQTEIVKQYLLSNPPQDDSVLKRDKSVKRKKPKITAKVEEMDLITPLFPPGMVGMIHTAFTTIMRGRNPDNVLKMEMEEDLPSIEEMIKHIPPETLQKIMEHAREESTDREETTDSLDEDVLAEELVDEDVPDETVEESVPEEHIIEENVVQEYVNEHAKTEPVRLLQRDTDITRSIEAVLNEM